MPTTNKPTLAIIALAAILLAATLLVTSHTAAVAQTTTDDYFVTPEEIAATPGDPVGLAHVGDDRLFVVERRGMIQVIDDGALLPTPFLDIRGQVMTFNWEQGLLGLVFHPNYAENGYFYVNYTGSDGHTRVSRFEVSDEDPNQADPTSEQVVLLVHQPEVDHNAGDMAFGPDGYLYVALGDGGLTTGSPNAQKRDNLLGKLLRIDVDRSAGSAPDCDISGEQQYTVPTDNPFHDGPGGQCDEIWVMGLRNPWRFSIDSTSGHLFIADVGLTRYEEINVVPTDEAAGSNFGWSCFEGRIPYFTERCDGAGPLVYPVGGYAHDETSCNAIVGGDVYRGAAYPQMQGHYLFADFCTGYIWRLRPDGEGWQQRLVSLAGHNITSITAAADGEFYATGLAGGIYRLHAGAAPFQAYLPSLSTP